MFCRGKQSVSRHRTLCFIKQNKLFLYVETNCFNRKKQTVLSCWNKVFFPIGTLCSALIKQIVLYRRIKLKLVCCRIFVTFSFSFLG
ncbi:hypothetical protein HMPREF2141_04185 [Bacteroides uniformis]|nr:hypothetical protein HMPREF2141_04185 [Bacteroides uniformis]